MIHKTDPKDAAVHRSGWYLIPEHGIEITCLPLLDKSLMLDDAKHLFARLTYKDALTAAKRFDARLIHPDRVRWLHEHGLELVAYLGTPTAEMTIEHSEAHDRDMWRQLSAFEWDEKTPVANCGKHWVAGAPEDKSRLMGWWSDAHGGWWQPDSIAHNRQHHDDGTTTMLERDMLNEPATKPPPPHRTHPGDLGDAVRTGQRFLLAEGYVPGPVDGKHGPRTEAAWQAWERDRSDTDPHTPILSLELPTVLFVQARNYTKASRRTVRLIVLHTAETPENFSVAEDLARWAAGPSAPQASWHFAADADSIVQCVREQDVAWAAPGANHDGLQIELAGRARQTSADWEDSYSRAQRDLACLLIAHLCRTWNVPARKLTVAEIKAGARGLVGHVDVTMAYKRSTHTDPGPAFPWHAYEEQIAMNLALL